MDRPRDYHTKWSKSEKDKYYMISFICGIYIQKRNRLTGKENKLMVTKGERDKLGAWD